MTYTLTEDDRQSVAALLDLAHYDQDQWIAYGNPIADYNRADLVQKAAQFAAFSQLANALGLHPEPERWLRLQTRLLERAAEEFAALAAA